MAVGMAHISAVDPRLFVILPAGAVVAQMAAIPYLFSLADASGVSQPVPVPVAEAVQIAQGAVLSAVAIALGLRMAKPLGLGAPLLRARVFTCLPSRTRPKMRE